MLDWHFWQLLENSTTEQGVREGVQDQVRADEVTTHLYVWILTWPGWTFVAYTEHWHYEYI